MFTPRGSGGDSGGDMMKYDASAGQWMREAMESRLAIEALKAQNDKLQREVYGLNSKLNLIYECCGELGVVDRLGDLMQRKLREFQATQAARNNPNASVHPMSSPQRATRKSDLGTCDDGFICGSSTFQDVAAFSSSYKGQVGRANFHRVNTFEAEEAKLRGQMDIFGVPKLPLQKPGGYSPTAKSGDTIDNLLSSTEAARSARQNGSARLCGSSPAEMAWAK